MSNWFTQHRQAWIAESLRIYGYVQRIHLQRKFGIAQAQASLDFRAFEEAHPDAWRYDPRAKSYRSTSMPDAPVLCESCGGSTATKHEEIGVADAP